MGGPSRRRAPQPLSSHLPHQYHLAAEVVRIIGMFRTFPNHLSGKVAAGRQGGGWAARWRLGGKVVRVGNQGSGNRGRGRPGANAVPGPAGPLRPSDPVISELQVVLMAVVRAGLTESAAGAAKIACPLAFREPHWRTAGARRSVRQRNNAGCRRVRPTGTRKPTEQRRKPATGNATLSTTGRRER